MDSIALEQVAMINVRVEERRLGVIGGANWRVHEFSGIEAVPWRVVASFGTPAERTTHALELLARIRDLQQNQRFHASFTEDYMATTGSKRTMVERTLTISIRQRAQDRPRRLAA